MRNPLKICIYEAKYIYSVMHKCIRYSFQMRMKREEKTILELSSYHSDAGL